MSDRADTFDGMRYGIRRRIIETIGREYADEWVRRPVPILDGKSLLDLYNEEDGYARVFRYLSDDGGTLR